MESFFTSQSKRIDLDGENWVEIKRLTWGESKQTISKATAAKDGEMIVDLGLVQQNQLVAAITNWGGPGFESREPTRENILALPVTLGDRIVEEIDALNGELTKDEKKG